MKKIHPLDKYTRVTVLGRGAFATVYLIRSCQDNQVYALKMIKKSTVIQKKSVQSILMEKKILSEIEHPFLIKLWECFQDNTRLYFVLEYCPGGQLFRLLSIRTKLSQQQCKFIAAQLVLALEVLHQHGIVYCDLKPENVLIDKTGYIKLTDFGLSKSLNFHNQQTVLVCGTPEYLAPQLLKKEKYGKSIDWWSLGCIIYEMATGHTPFHSQNRNQLFTKIFNQPIILPNLSPAIQNLISRLLQKDPKERLGTNGSFELRNHFWFHNVDWQQLLKKAYSSPFAPKLKSEADVSNFDQEFTSSPLDSDQEIEELLCDDMDFQGFEMVHK